MPKVQQISANELNDLLKSQSEVVLLDVRQPDERAFAVIDTPHASADLFIPLGELQARVGEVEETKRASAFLLVYCHHGVRSLAAANWLAGRKMENVLNLAGGIDAWSMLVDPAVRRY